jgi:uncharacterized cupredoxin-like copper-binding protein
MRESRLLVLFPLALAAALTLAACGGGDDDSTGAPTTTADAGRTVDVVLNEWAIEPSVASVTAGEVTFKVTNEGAIAHDFVVVRTDLGYEDLPLDGAVVDEDKVEVLGRTTESAGGGTQEIVLTLTPGKYVLICNIATHYQLKLRTPFEVE